MPQPIDMRLSEPSQTSNIDVEEEDADLDLTLQNDVNDNPEQDKNTQNVPTGKFFYLLLMIKFALKKLII